MQSTIPLYAGYDGREAAGYHAFTQSVLDKASVPVAFHPLHKPMLGGFDGQRDGTNAFTHSRFLVPFLQDFQGWALFADGSDMVATDDIAGLWEHRKPEYAAMVVKHDYKSKHARKYIGTSMEADNASYERKNWSSLVLWNCGHPANRILTPDFVSQSPGSLLHRFGWLKDDLIGEIPQEWNCIVGEMDISGASLLHFSLGIPAMKFYQHSHGSEHWHRAHRNATFCVGED